MKLALLRVLLVAWLVFWKAGSLEASKTYGNLKTVEFLECYDGDTCYFDIPQWHDLVGKRLPVRLAGIDSPEIRGKCQQEKTLAKQAKNWINQRLNEAEQIELRHTQRGKYFRVVAEVWADGENLNQAMIAQNFAVAYEGQTKTFDFCKNTLKTSQESLLQKIFAVLNLLWYWLSQIWQLVTQ